MVIGGGCYRPKGGRVQTLSTLPLTKGLTGSCPVQGEFLDADFAAAVASAALTDSVDRKVTDVDLGIGARFVGRLCNLERLFVRGGKGEEDKDLPTIGESCDSVLVLPCACSFVKKSVD